MKWNEWISVLFPLALKVAGYLIPALGGALGGPIGWIVSFLLSQGTKMLVDMAERASRYAKISAKVRKQVAETDAAAQAFFELEDKRERGETISPEVRDAAKLRLKNSARALIRIERPSAR